MNNRFSDLQEQSLAVQQRIDRIQMDIDNDRQVSVERRTGIGAIKMFETCTKVVFIDLFSGRAIESMFDLVRKYSHHSRRKDFHLQEGLTMNPLMKLKHVCREKVLPLFYLSFILPSRSIPFSTI